MFKFLLLFLSSSKLLQWIYRNLELYDVDSLQKVWLFKRVWHGLQLLISESLYYKNSKRSLFWIKAKLTFNWNTPKIESFWSFHQVEYVACRVLCIRFCNHGKWKPWMLEWRSLGFAQSDSRWYCNWTLDIGSLFKKQGILSTEKIQFKQYNRNHWKIGPG